MSALKVTAPETDPVERAREIVAIDKAPSRKRQSEKQWRRETTLCVMEEHLQSLEKVAVIHAHATMRMRTLLSEIKRNEGYDWEMPFTAAGLFGTASLITDVAVQLVERPALDETGRDPILAAVEAHDRGWNETYTADLRKADGMPTGTERENARREAADRQQALWLAVRDGQPSTLAGAAAMARCVLKQEQERMADPDSLSALEGIVRALEAIASKVVKA